MAESLTKRTTSPACRDQRQAGLGAARLNQHARNQEISKLLEEIARRGTTPSAAERDQLMQYEGSGGQGSNGATGEGLLYEFYTPAWLCELMWELARFHGFPADGWVLEPSCATGRLLTPAPDYSRCIGFEINTVSARIAELCHPGVKVYTDYFETAFLKPPRYTEHYGTKNRFHRGLEMYSWLLDGTPAGDRGGFDLVIGNPPYGVYRNQYSTYFKPQAKLCRQIDVFFTYAGLRLLRTGGLLVFLTGSNFLRNGDAYNDAKAAIGDMADLVDAYRLPPVFGASKVPTDIFILRRK